MSGPASTLDLACAELVALWAPLWPTPGDPGQLTVTDGAPLTTAIDYLIVGDAPDDQGGGSTASGSWVELDGAGMSKLEEYDVSCQLSAWDGDADIPTVRARLIGYLTQLRDALRAQPSISAQASAAGVSRASIAGSWVFGQSDAGGDGTTTTLRFAVHVTAVTV